MTLLSAFPGVDGFLPGSRGSLMVDVVFLAMFAVLPILGWSIWEVKFNHRYTLHKRVQVTLGIVLALAVTAFEIEMRVVGWRERAEPSPYYNADDPMSPVFLALWVHLFFAIPTAVLWVAVIVQALRKFPNPPGPCAYSDRHIRWARLAAIELTLTALTGWIFYWIAFVA